MGRLSTFFLFISSVPILHDQEKTAEHHLHFWPIFFPPFYFSYSHVACGRKRQKKKSIRQIVPGSQTQKPEVKKETSVEKEYSPSCANIIYCRSESCPCARVLIAPAFVALYSTWCTPWAAAASVLCLLVVALFPMNSTSGSHVCEQGHCSISKSQCGHWGQINNHLTSLDYEMFLTAL